MSLIAMLESSKEVAMAAREAAELQSAQDVADFEEYGADLAKALDEEEILAAEEALRLGMKFDVSAWRSVEPRASRQHTPHRLYAVDSRASSVARPRRPTHPVRTTSARFWQDEEQEAASEREREDLELARRVLAEDETGQIDTAKDERLARQLDDQLRKEAEQVAKLEKRERQLADKELCHSDLRMALSLAQEIEAQEQALIRDEKRDRRLAEQLVKEEGKLLKDLPQTEEKLKMMAKSINGEMLPMRARLLARLGVSRKALMDTTNRSQQLGVAH